MIVIIDYGAGNLISIKNMLKKIGYRNVIISSDISTINNAEKLILPGVGHFDYGMRQLKASGLVDVLDHVVLEDKKPLLGICLGAQLLTRGSEEGKEKGLGWIEADTVKFDSSLIDESFKIPHMGWSDVVASASCGLFEGMYKDPRFYFVHSYHIVCDDPSNAVVKANYGYEFVAGVENENILGMQFHPEKSHKYGMKLLSNFIKNY